MSESASLTESTESLDIWLWSPNILSCLIRGPDSNEHLVTLCITEMRSPAMGPMGLGDFSSGKKEKVHPDLQNTKRRLGYQVPDIYIYIRVFFQFYYFLHLYTFINTDYPCAFTRGHVFTKSAGLNLAEFYNCSHLPASVECCSLAVYTTLPTWKTNDSRCERVEHVLIRSPAD